MRGIILDGVSASGKSSILALVQQRIVKEYPSSTKLFISEHYTQRMLEHELEAKTLSADHVEQHVDEIIDNLDRYQDMLNKSKFANNPSGAEAFVTIERFLLTFLATQEIDLSDYSEYKAQQQLKKLGDLNITQYLLVLSESNLKEHIARTLTHRNDKWAEYINSRGGVNGLVKHSLEWQEYFISLADTFKDVITTEIIEINDWNYEKIANKLFEDSYQGKGA
jgi:hypothetical protein